MLMRDLPTTVVHRLRDDPPPQVPRGERGWLRERIAACLARGPTTAVALADDLDADIGKVGAALRSMAVAGTAVTRRRVPASPGSRRLVHLWELPASAGGTVR